jgi:hypothetical protein
MHNNLFFLKPLLYQREGDFIDGHCIIFSTSFCLIMFHELEYEALWPLKNCKLYFMYIDFVQSSNHWIKIKFDSK